MSRYGILYFILMSWMISFCSAETVLKSRLETIFHEESPTDAQWSVHVVEKNEKKTLFQHAPNRRLIPASNVKLPICAAALLRLGATFTYQTRLYITGQQSGNHLDGNIIVVGQGDPSIGGRFNGGDITYLFRQWAVKLKQANITSVSGDVIGVDDEFDDERIGLNWHPDDYVEWYAAEISALSFNDGCIDVIVKGASRAGRPASITFDPLTKYMSLKGGVRTVASRNAERGTVFKREPGSRILQISAAIRPKRQWTRWASVPNPTLYFVTVLKETLEKEGIRISGKPGDADEIKPISNPETWREIAVHNSPPLSQLVEVCLKNSQNLYAEHFFKTVGAKEYGVGSLQTGAAAVKDILFRHGCDFDRQYLADGSGLSRENRLSADALTNVLQAINQSPFAEELNEALPLAGVDGTLERRMRGTGAYKHVRAKTGTLSGVRALSGYIYAKSGKTYLFAMIANGPRSAYRFSRIMDDVCEAVVETG